jgi:Txe/YoeB family toxin of toxin-antitoxin system
MVKWQVVLSRQAVKDSKKIAKSGLKEQTQELLNLLEGNPFHTPPAYEKLVGNLSGFYSRRINIQHRLVYSIDKKHRTIHVLRLWTHYE